MASGLRIDEVQYMMVDFARGDIIILFDTNTLVRITHEAPTHYFVSSHQPFEGLVCPTTGWSAALLNTQNHGLIFKYFDIENFFLFYENQSEHDGIKYFEVYP